MKAYQAYASNCTATAETPRAAAIKFFADFPNKRKCNITEGETDGRFFTVRYGRKSEGDWPQSWKDITKKTANTLPEGSEK